MEDLSHSLSLTYNITNDWDWDTPVADKIFEVTAKGTATHTSATISALTCHHQMLEVCAADLD